MSLTSGLSGLFSSDEENKKRIAWSRATEIAGHANYRIDCDGRMICWSHYGSLGQYGWEIDHATPLGLGGLDVLGNIRARHWQGNRKAGGILGGLLNTSR